MFLTPDREVVTQIGAAIARQVADAKSQLAQVPADSREHDQLVLRMHQLRQATNRFSHLMNTLREQGRVTPAPHFVVGLRGIAHRSC